MSQFRTRRPSRKVFTPSHIHSANTAAPTQCQAQAGCPAVGPKEPGTQLAFGESLRLGGGTPRNFSPPRTLRPYVYGGCPLFSVTAAAFMAPGQERSKHLLTGLLVSGPLHYVFTTAVFLNTSLGQSPRAWCAHCSHWDPLPSFLCASAHAGASAWKVPLLSLSAG